MHRRARYILVLTLATMGCHLFPVYQDNPTTVVNPSYDQVWDTTIKVVEKYFDVAYENRYDGRIETQPLAAATLFEPWRPDVISLYDRAEATVQSIRRVGFILIQPSPSGAGFTVVVEVYKELEFLPFPIFNQLTGGPLITSIEPTREALITSAIRPTAGWISLGRDQLLESAILREIQKKLDRQTPARGNISLLRFITKARNTKTRKG